MRRRGEQVPARPTSEAEIHVLGVGWPTDLPCSRLLSEKECLQAPRQPKFKLLIEKTLLQGADRHDPVLYPRCLTFGSIFKSMNHLCQISKELNHLGSRA